MTIPAVSRRNIAIRLEATVWISSACHGTPDRPAPDEADPLHLPRVQRRGRPRPAQHERVGDADRGMASRIEIATDAVDLVVTDCDVLTAPAHKRASMDAEYRARGRRQRGRSRLALVERTATLFAFVLYDDTQSHHGHSGAPRPSEPGHPAGCARAGLPVGAFHRFLPAYPGRRRCAPSSGAVGRGPGGRLRRQLHPLAGGPLYAPPGGAD